MEGAYSGQNRRGIEGIVKSSLEMYLRTNHLK